MSKPDRSRSVCGLIPAIFVLLAFTGAAGAREDGARLVSSAGGAITFEVTVPGAGIVPASGGTVRLVIDGYGTFSPPGAVELPGRTFRVAIPPFGEPRVSTTVLEEERLGPLNLFRVPGERFIEGENGIPITEQYYPPDPWANGGGLPLVEAFPASFMGRQRILPIRINPIVLDAGGARFVRKLSVTVSFGSAGALSRTDVLGEAPLGGAWKRLYDELLVNPGDAPRFRKPLDQALRFAAAAEVGKKLKIRIPETGIYFMRADSLIAAGLSAGLATGELALKKHYYDETRPDLARTVDVPVFFVEGAGTAPGVFDGSDLLYFYSFGLKDDAEALDTNALYAADNVLWLEEEVAGSLMPLIPPALPSADTLRQFTATMKYRTDTWYMKNAVPGTFDFYYAKGPVVTGSAVPFELNHPASPGTFSLTFRLQGNDPLGVTHIVSFSVRNATGTHPIGTGSFFSKEARTYTFTGLSSSWLVDGQNELVVTCDADYKYLINDFAINYSALFVASGDRLEFAVGPLIDPWAIPISGFSTNSGFLVDVTNPRSPSYRALGPSDFVSAGSGYRLVIDLDESYATRRFIAFGGGAAERLAVRAVSVDAPSRLRETAGSYQALVISHRDFMARSAEYAAWRRSQGYRVLLADVEDVYDEFNGGLAHADAIKRYIKYGFNHWGVEYIVLVGDASEDHKRLYYGPDPDLQGSAPDYVPSFTYSASVSGTYDDEVIYSDKYYAFLDEIVPVSSGIAGAPLLPGGYPDVFIGRLPVGRDVELRAIINKTKRMETPQPNDAWRRRVVLFSDDAWSGRGNDYRYLSYEYEFERSTDSCAAAVERALPGGFDVQRLHLSLYTDPIHPNRTESGPAVLFKSTTATRSTFTPALNKALNRGCLWYMFQGHGNRAVLTTESAYSLGWYMDPDSLRTYTPFVFVGVGCHISDFAIQAEYNTFGETGPYGDCMSEQLLFKSGAGAVATYASAGFEYLSQNAVLVERLHRTLFQALPADSVGPRNEYTGAHWIFGEAIAKAEIEQIDNTSYGSEQVFRYCVLGDPMLRIDPGPPLMRLEADSAGEYRVVSPGETMRARDGTNLIKLRLTVSDIVAIGRITLRVNGEDSTGSLRITRLVDQDPAIFTYARSYQVDYDYTIDPNDDNLLFQVFAPDGREVGSFEIPIRVAQVQLVYSNNNRTIEIVPGVESPPTGTFTVKADFPAYLPQAPELSIDGDPQPGIIFTTPDQNRPLHWEAAFVRTFVAGEHVFTVKAGDLFLRDIQFVVTGNEIFATNVFSIPNPFSSETYIQYELNISAESITIDIYNVSGVLIRSLPVPRDQLEPARFPYANAVLWDGRDLAGDRVANGTYIYVIHISRLGKTIDIKGKSVKLE